MTLGIFVPSRSRYSETDVDKGPMADMSQDLRRRVVYVVPEDEVSLYERVVHPRGGLVVGAESDGIAETRYFIGMLAQQQNMDKFIMLDDDIRFLVRRSSDTWQLRGTETIEVDELMTQIESLLEEYGHVGVSPREGNNRIGEGDPPLIAVNTRTLRALAYRTEDFLGVEHGRVRVMEDFDVNLQLLERGIPNCSIHYWAQGQKMTNAPGGCSTYRSHAVHEESAQRLSELHPGLVSLRQKSNKTDREGFGTRTEVTIQWKRAYRG